MAQEITVTLKTLDHKRFDVTLNPEDTIESKVEMFKSLTGYTEFNIKMIHSGRILDRLKTFSESGLKTGETIVVMKLRVQPVQPVQPEPPVVPLVVVPPVVVPTPVVANVAHSTSASTQPARSRSSGSIPTPPPVQHAQGRVIFPVVERSPTRRASNNPNDQSPHPPLPQRPMIITTQQYWDQVAPLEEISPRFSVEQVHAIVPLLMSYITENPQLCTFLLRSQESFRAVITGPGFRGIVRQMLEQSPLIVGALRTGTPANMTINSTSNSIQEASPDNADTNHESDSSRGEDSNDYENAAVVTNMVPVLAELLSAVANATEPVIEPNEQEDIAQLVSLTGVPASLAKQVYDSCGKNVGIAAEMLFQVINGEI